MDARIIVAIAIVCLGCGCAIYRFIRKPQAQKIANVKEWLKYAVVEAEKALGEKTGQLKLHMVYDMAVKQFPWIAQLIAFNTFSEWVDEALEWMKNQLSDNEAAQNYVDGE